MSHTFYIYDSDRCKVSSCWVHPSANLIQAMSVRMAELEQKRLGRSPRLARLAHRLLQHFPLTEHADLWQGQDPLATARSLEVGVWKLKIPEARRDEFLSVLLPLARQLYFTVFDPTRELYVEFDTVSGEYVFPASVTERDGLDPQARTEKFTRGSLRKRLVEILKPLLAQEGFAYEPLEQGGFQFRRKIEGGEQLIYGWIGTLSTGFKCNPCLKARSDRKFEISKLESPGADLGYEGAATALWEHCADIRKTTNPDWSTDDTYGSEYCRSVEEVDWLIEDIMALGLPVLEKARTIEGLYWLYCDPAAKSVFSGNMYNRGGSDFYRAYAARQADNAKFDEIADYLIGRLKPGQARFAALQEWIEFLREKVEPFGSGPA